MRRRLRPAALALVVALGMMAPRARAGFVRGTLKIDVRSPAGAPLQAHVVVRAASGGEPRPVSRAGQVYVVDGLTDGNWRIEVAGAAPQVVRVSGHEVVGAVFVLGGRGRGARFTIGPDEPACDDDAGEVIEAVAFAHGGLAAGRLDVRRGRRRVCAATIAGGGATLRLKPGEYEIDARFVGGGGAHVGYAVREDRAPPPLMLRAR